MIRFIRRLIARYRLHLGLQYYDRQIAEARRKHRPVKHLQLAKTDYMHALLRSGRP